VPGQPGTRWGWHQLDRAWARRLVVEAEVRPGDLVVDAGAGTGALTRPLVAAGARVIAVELNRARAKRLRDAFGETIVVVQADAGDLRLPRRPFRVIANPPFAAADRLIRRLLAPGSRLLDAHLVVSRSTGRRWSGNRAPGFGRWSAGFTLTVGPAVPRQVFRPAPPRDPVLLRIVRR
jgi:23S rRNA (adenine-N6)-dimethyltransferase